MPSLNRQFWLLPVFAGISLAYAGWSGYTLLWFFFYLCLACIALALVYRARNWRLVTVTRDFRTAEKILEAGSDLRIVLLAKVHGVLPWPWLELRDNLPRTLKDHIRGRSGGHLAWARRGSVQYVPYTLKNLPRGIHQWENVGISSGDPLGLVNFQNRIGLPDQLVVYPRTVELRAQNFFPLRVEGAATARKAVSQGATQLVGIRDYRPGDRLSLIHWKSTAKTGELQTKEFDPLLLNSSLLVLDCSYDAWAAEADSSFEEAVSAAASFAKAALLQRVPLRFRSNFGRRPLELAVTTHAQYYQLLLRLAAIAPTGRSLLSQSLYRELFIQDSNVIIITSGHGEEIMQILYRLSARGNAVAVIQVAQGAGTELLRPRSGSALKLIRIQRAQDLSPGQGKRGVV